MVKTLTFLKEPRACNEKWTIGQEQVVIEAVVALFCGGHTLLVSKSGLAKTRPVDMLEKVFELSANWVQSKPDLMPEDILDPEILGINNDYALAFCVASLHSTFRQTLRFLSGAAAMEILGCFFVS